MPHHINLRVDLPEGALDINLSFFDKKMSTLVATNTETLHEASKMELPALVQNLQDEGFHLSQPRCVLDCVHEEKKDAHWASLSAVDLEV